MPKKKIAIIGALDAEVDEYLKHLESPVRNIRKGSVFHEGRLCGQDLIVIKSGVGKVFAALNTQKLIDIYNPQCVIFTGVAGGLNKKFEIGDVVVAEDCLQHDLDARGLGFPRGTIPYTDYNLFVSDVRLRTLALSAKIRPAIHRGRILTGDQFLTKKELNEYKYLIEDLKGDAVEMEGASVAQVCTVNKVPFLIIRTISDKADAEASINFNKFLPKVAKNSFFMVRHILGKY